LASRSSQKLLDVASASLAEGGSLVQWSDKGTANQRWIVRMLAGGYYSLININSGMALSLDESGANNADSLVQTTYHQSEGQQWRIGKMGDGSVYLINRLNGKALGAQGNNDGASLTMAALTSDVALQWRAQLLGGVDVPVVDNSTTNGATNHWVLSGNLGTHDPTMMEENGRWYLFQTGTGIYGKVSADGKKWDPLASVLPNPLNWWTQYVPGNTNNDVWAPDVKRYGGRVWLYYSVSTFGKSVSTIGLLSAASLAAGAWRDEGMVINSTGSSNYNAIDPDLVTDEYGDPWLTFGSFWSGIKLTRLNPLTMKPVGQLFSIASYQPGIEAPSIVYRQGYYYLFVSRDKCCVGVSSTYNIRYGRAKTINGPYLDKNGAAMSNGGGSLLDGGNDRWIGPGGQDIVNTNIVVRHAYDATANGNATLLISTLNWDASGWPKY
jgi:arabinan endo-1,5-alpha-L-arabinosidase